jgi:hypothetical protein
MDWRNDHLETAPHGDSSHIQSPNPDTTGDANKCLMTGTWYSLLRGSASAWKIQKWMLLSIHWTKHRVPNEWATERTQGAEGFHSLIGLTTIWTNQYPPDLPGFNHQSKKTHVGTHSSSCICSRGWHSRSSMGGEAQASVVYLPQYRGLPGSGSGLVNRGNSEGIGEFPRGN